MQQQDFLFELGCEELPPKALAKLATSLHDFIASSLQTLDLNFDDSEWFATPRRLAVRFVNLDITQQDKQVEKLGPAVAAAFDSEGNAKPAAMGFAKSNGVNIADLQRKETSKGERLAFIANVKGQSTKTLLQDLIVKAVAQLPVPKAMKWGTNNFQFSRPVHWVMALLGNDVIDVKLFDCRSSNLTFGHRFHAPQAITISAASEYEQKLSAANVIACFAERKAKIRIQVEALAKQNGGIAVISEDLLEEVAALVEWPVALLGDFDDEFLQVPAEALISSMTEHQKYFHLVDNNDQLLAKFITISNINSSRPESVIDGNEKVIRPRLADAKFFYDSDCKNTLESYIPKLKNIVFQNKLGTLFDKSQRVKTLAIKIANELSIDSTHVERAALIYKCDLMSDMVGEFSDLQGIMGRYYADKDGEDKEVVLAMDEVYMPRFSGDKLPSTKTGIILAIAERLDSLVGIFGIGQIPTGAKDPFALRRSALGIVRLISEKQLDLDLAKLIEYSMQSYSSIQLESETKQKLLAFFAARSLALYQDQGVPAQVIKSVQILNITKPTDLYQRIKAVEIFNRQSESSDLAEANKRVKNILAKSDFSENDIKIDPSLFIDEEIELYQHLQKAKIYIDDQLDKKDYQNALNYLASLKDPVNVFFDNVMINADDINVRNNRLALINELRNLFIGIAEISLLQK